MLIKAGLSIENTRCKNWRIFDSLDEGDIVGYIVVIPLFETKIRSGTICRIGAGVAPIQSTM